MLPPLEKWTLDEILDEFSPYGEIPTSELKAELARRFEIEDSEAVLDILLEMGVISENDWELATDFWDSGMAF